jgi:hypothetical protein
MKLRGAYTDIRDKQFASAATRSWSIARIKMRREKPIIRETRISPKRNVLLVREHRMRFEVTKYYRFLTSIGGEGGIRTHVPFQTTAFRVRLVMTASILLLIL